MRLAVIGDLHLDEGDPRFASARDQLRERQPAHVVGLGDFGAGRRSGTRGSFEQARSWFEGLDAPWEPLLGNHDLERVEAFPNDAAAVACFCEVMEREKPYRAFDLGDALGITLSNTRFREKRGYAHEVTIDEEQFAWFRETLERNPARPTFVFSHAPPLGSRLRVLQHPHLRGGNAWLNQSSRPQRYADLLAAHPQVRLWFSGHNHLGQDHPRALSHVGHCLFVHTGVIGRQSRDGLHQSRIVDFDGANLEVKTLDHTRGEERTAARFDLAANHVELRSNAEAAPVRLPFFEAPDSSSRSADAVACPEARSVFVRSQGMWVEFDGALDDPVGVVGEHLGTAPLRFAGDQLLLGGALRRHRIERNEDGYFFQIPSRRRRLLGGARAALRALIRRRQV